MREDERTAMIAPPPPRMMGPATRPVARVAPPRKRGSTGIVVALTLLGILAVAALAAGLYLANRTPLTDVPTLKGRTQAEADALLQQKHLVAGTPQNDQSPTCAKGKITNQSPEAGLRVPEGSTIGYTLCVGPGKTTVPLLVGHTVDQARAALQTAKLNGTFQAIDSDKPANTVVAVDPAENSSVDVGSAVTVKYSKGNLKVLPDLKGKTKDEAESALNQAGFTNYNFANQTTSNQDDVGKVVGTDHTANKAYAANEKITVFIGKSSATTGPPTPTGTPTGSPTP